MIIGADNKKVRTLSGWDGSEVQMARRLKDLKELKIKRPPRIKLSAKESLKRTKEFDKRKERFISAVASQRDE